MNDLTELGLAVRENLRVLLGLRPECTRGQSDGSVCGVDEGDVVRGWRNRSGLFDIKVDTCNRFPASPEGNVGLGNSQSRQTGSRSSAEGMPGKGEAVIPCDSSWKVDDSTRGKGEEVGVL